MFPPSITMLYPQTSLPPLAQERYAQVHCMTVGDQLNSHFLAQKPGRSRAPLPCRPHHGHQPQNQRIPLLRVTDHSSGHTEEWESLTPTRGARPKRGKTLPGARHVPGALTYPHRVQKLNPIASGGYGGQIGPSVGRGDGLAVAEWLARSGVGTSCWGEGGHGVKIFM